MSGGGNLPIGPGIWGFIAFFLLAIALWLLVRNMNTRLRRMAYRDRDRADELQTTAAPADTVGGAETAGAAGATGATQSADADGAAPGRADDEGPDDGGTATDGAPRA